MEPTVLRNFQPYYYLLTMLCNLWSPFFVLTRFLPKETNYTGNCFLLQWQPDDCYYACNEQGNYLYAQKLKMSEAKSVLRPLKNDQLNGRPNFGMLCNTIVLIREKTNLFKSWPFHLVFEENGPWLS